MARMASCLARRWVLVFFFLVSHINTGNTRCYSSGATSRAPRRNAASARASIILLQVLGRTGTSSIDPSARLRGGGPQDADGSSLGTGMLEADRLGKDDAGAAKERAGSGDGLRRSGVSFCRCALTRVHLLTEGPGARPLESALTSIDSEPMCFETKTEKGVCAEGGALRLILRVTPQASTCKSGSHRCARPLPGG